MRASFGLAPQYFGFGTSVTGFDATSMFLPSTSHGPFWLPSGMPPLMGQPLVIAAQFAVALPLSMMCLASSGDEPLPPAKKPFQSANGWPFLKVNFTSVLLTATTFCTWSAPVVPSNEAQPPCFGSADLVSLKVKT